MTPFEIQILIHYHITDDPFPNLDTPSGNDAVSKFISAGILYRSQDGNVHRVSGAMDLYIQAICDVQLPKQIWIMPDQKINPHDTSRG